MSLFINKLSSTICCIWLLSTYVMPAHAIDIRSSVLEGIDGNQHALGKFIGRGKWAILNIWGPKCPPCQEETPDLVQFHDDHKNHDAIVVSVAIDFPSYGYAQKKDVIRFAEDYLIDYPLLLGDGDVTQKLGLGRLTALPTTFIYTPDGELVATQIGNVTRTSIEQYIDNYQQR